MIHSDFPRLTRRQAIQATLATTALAMHPSALLAAPQTCRLAMGTYGLQSLPLEETLKAIADVGFDGVEVAAMPTYPGDPAGLSARARTRLRRLLHDQDLALDAVMAGIIPDRSTTQQAANRERLKECFQLARDLAPDGSQPLVQTILGGKPSSAVPDFFLTELQDWKRLAEEAKIVIAIKPHRGQTVSTPGAAIRIMRELGNSPWIRMAFDYSHFVFRQLPLADMIALSRPWTDYVVLKGAVKEKDEIRFTLPGQETAWDQADVVRRFYQAGYRGSFCCEISSHVWSHANYHPRRAIETCYAHMSDAFERAKVRRP